MKVGVLGSGVVAQTLAAGLAKYCHQVMIGSRSPEKLAEFVAKTDGVTAGTFAEAAAFGELLILAVKGNAALDVLELAGVENVDGKTVIDTCNPIADAPPVNGVLQFYTRQNESLMETLQTEYPDADFVKAFNSVGAPRMVDPKFEGGRPTMFICGKTAAAKQTVTALLDEFGWETADMGGVETARAIEPLCKLWCVLGFTHNEWTHAFKLLRK
jgi:hypothetical protein